MAGIQRFLLVCVFFGAAAAPMSAQVIERPPRVYRGLFGGGNPDVNRWRHSVTFTGNAFGGFDNNLVPTADATTTNSGNMPGHRGYSGFGGAQVRYSSTKATRSIEFDARGFTNGFSGLDVERVFGGEASGRIATPLGSRFVLTAYERYSDTPMFAPETALPRSELDGPLQPASVPLANTTSYLIRRSRTADGNVVLERRMTRTMTLVASGSHGRTDYDDGAGDTKTWSGTLSYQQGVGRSSSVVAGYTFTSNETQASGVPPRPMDNHNLTFSASTSRRLGPRRQLAMSINAGVDQVRTISGETGAPLSYSTPTGQVSVRVDFARSWNVGADYGRTVSVIEGVTLDSFVNDAVALRAGGRWHSAEIAVTADWMTGEAGPTGSGTYESASGTLQVQVPLNRWVDALVSQTFYAYRLDGVTTIVEGLPQDLDRLATRVGFVFRLPLYGRFAADPSPGGRR